MVAVERRSFISPTSTLKSKQPIGNLQVLYDNYIRLVSRCMATSRVAAVREKCLENEFFSRSGKCQGILWMAREI